MLLLLAAIAFGPLGIPQRDVFDDGTVRAELRFQIAHDRQFDTGPAGVSPSIAAGSLTIVFGGRRRTYALASIFAIHEARVLIPHDGACGTERSLVRRGHYLAIEAMLAQKGCAPMAAFIDLESGQVVEDVVVGQARPEHLAGQSYRVIRTDSVVLKKAEYDHGYQAPPTMHPWPFVMLHATDARGDTHAFAYCIYCRTPAPPAGSESPPSIGSFLTIGPGADYPDFSEPRNFPGERVVYY